MWRQSNREPRRRTNRCSEGVHYPFEAGAMDDKGMVRSTCRYCGCPIVKFEGHRKWYVSAVLG